MSFVVPSLLAVGSSAFGIGSLLLGINLAPDFISSLKLECSPLRPVLIILLACDEHLSVVGYKTQQGYFLTLRPIKVV